MRLILLWCLRVTGSWAALFGLLWLVATAADAMPSVISVVATMLFMAAVAWVIFREVEA